MQRTARIRAKIRAARAVRLFIIYILRSLPTEKAQNKFGSQAGLRRNPTANQMARIAFSMCEENDTSNQVPRIMFFDV